MKSLTLLSSLLMAVIANAQPHTCWGPSHEAQMQARLQHNLTNLDADAATYRDIRFVPIKFHMVADGQGNGAVAITDILDQLCRLNQDFLAHDIQFFLKDGINFISEEALYTYGEYPNEAGDAIMLAEQDDNAINVFIVNEVGQTFSIPSTYFPTEDWILINKDFVHGDGLLLPHEVGHFFSLLHTFTGWPAPYDESVYGLQAPSMAANGTPTELADQSNCEIAGDFICDTPPDYWFTEPFVNCRYVGEVTDPNGAPVDPDEQLIMSYYFDCPRDGYHFSPIQGQVMNADLETPERAYLQASPIGNMAAISGVPELLTPLNGETLPGTMVEFSWTAVENAEAYLLEVSRSPNFSVDYVGLVIYGTSLLANHLIPDAKYYWRVRPYNSYQVCQSPGNPASFETGVELAQANLIGPDFWSVYPNPIASGQSLHLSIFDRTPFRGNVKLLNTAGQVLHRQVLIHHGRDQQFRLPLPHLAAGIYWITLQTLEGASVQKIVISDN